jgi:hypothetical protein
MNNDSSLTWYEHQIRLRLLRGESVTLPLDPHEPPNVHSIEAARTRRATALMLRWRAMSGPTDPAA